MTAMTESILSTTRILAYEDLSVEELNRVVAYLAGPEARVAVVEDKTPLQFRSKLLDAYQQSSDRVVRLDNVYPDPKVEDIMQMAETLRDKHIDVIIGFGGGSTMDSAKGVAAVLSNGGDLEEYLGAAATRKIEKHSVKLILIPTTAGTGAEVTKFGVYTARTGRKYTLNNPMLQADVALLVSSYTYDLPAKLTAATAFDALSHALETLWNKNATPVSDLVAIQSAVHILQVMEGAYENDKEQRAKMLTGACMAGISFNMTGTAACHALSFILSEEWHVPHGMACAFTLEDVFRINMQEASTCAKLAKVAAGIFGPQENDKEAAERLLERIISLKKKFGLPFNFADIGVDKSAEELCPLFDKSLEDPKMWNNVPPFDLDRVYSIVKGKCRRN